MDDFTAKVTAALVDANGNTIVYQALVERDGKFWVENLPAPLGSNLLQLTVTDVVGNMSVTNIAVVNSAITMTMDPLEVSGDQLYTNVTGTINSSDYTVWVNGVKAWLKGDGTWIASNTPVSPGGTAVFQARAIPNSDNDGNGTGSGARSSLQGFAAAGDTSGGANPNSSRAADLENQKDKPPMVYLESFHTNYRLREQSHEDVYNRLGGNLKYYFDDNYTETSALRWDNNSTASANRFMTDDYKYPNGHLGMSEDLDEITVLDSWPEPTSQPYYGTEVYTEYWNHQLYCQDTYTIGPPAVRWECRHTRDQDAGQGDGWSAGDYLVWNWEWDQAFVVRAKVKLFTGSKGLPRLHSIFMVSAGATKMPEGTPLHAYVLGQPDVTYVNLGDNAIVDVTPTASANWYRFSVTASKHTPYISANGIDLRTNTPEFCVGQQVTFALNWDYGQSPPNVIDTAYGWNLPQKFVNEPYPYSSSCNSYRRNDALLRYRSTSCWFVSGQGGGASVDASLHFSNGQHVSVAGRGTMKVYRPTAEVTLVDMPQYYTISENLLLTCKLRLGDSNGNGDMTYRVSVNSKPPFYGDANITQLITANYSAPWWVFSDERADGSEWYDNQAPGRVILTGITGLDDGPSEIWESPNIVSLTARDFVRFQPDGGIWVTLGIIRWETVGVAEQDIWTHWSITADATTGPDGPDQSDEFPRWTKIQSPSSD